MCKYTINGIETNSGLLVFSSDCKAEIEINGVFFKLIFIENGEDTSMSADLEDNKHHFIFRNLFRSKSTSMGINLPLRNGKVTKIEFAIQIIGSGPVKSIILNYSYRNE